MYSGEEHANRSESINTKQSNGLGSKSSTQPIMQVVEGCHPRKRSSKQKLKHAGISQKPQDNGYAEQFPIEKVGDANFTSYETEDYYCECIEKWLDVPKSLIFHHSIGNGIYETTLKIKNNSSRLNLSYYIIPTCKEKFLIPREMGVLAPKCGTNISIISKQLAVKDFGDICIEGFLVLSTPAYFDSHHQSKKLNLLWKAYGSKSFPFDAAEKHQIEIMIPASDSYMDSYNIIERSLLGSFVSRRRINWANLPNCQNDDKEFVANWTPTEQDDALLDYARMQVKIARKVTKDMKSKVEVISTAVKSILVAVVLIVGTVSVRNLTNGFVFPFSGRQYGPNGQELHASPSQGSWF